MTLRKYHNFIRINVFKRLLEAISKIGFWLKVPRKPNGIKRRDRVSTRRHTQVCRGLETKSQHGDWDKRLF
jgi:hypothetical protein